MAALVVQSRFAGLKIEDDDHPVNESQDSKKTKENPTKKLDSAKKVKTSITKPQPVIKKRKQKPVEATSEQWEQWKQKDAEIVDGNFESQLEEAILLSKLDYEEKKDIYHQLKKDADVEKKLMEQSRPGNKKHKKKHVMSLEQFNDMISNGDEPNNNATVFLGMTLDTKLQWSTHITTLAGKLSSAAYAVRKIRQFIDVETAKLVYFAYFHSVMYYGMLLWDKCADNEKIFVLQKRAIRGIYNLSPRDSLREKFKEIVTNVSPDKSLAEEPKQPDKDIKFFENVQSDIKSELIKEKMLTRVKNHTVPESVITRLQFTEALDQKDKEISSLKQHIISLKEELFTVKSRNKKLCNILGQGEMKDKAEILMEVERLRGVQLELTAELASLHTELEKERSKNAESRNKDKRYPTKKKKIRFDVSSEAILSKDANNGTS